MVLGVHRAKNIYPQETIFTNLLLYYVNPVHTFYDILVCLVYKVYFYSSVHLT